MGLADSLRDYDLYVELSRPMPRKRRRKPRRSQVRHDAKRKIGFHCAWCPPSQPHNERFVPHYYRVAPEHQRDPWMCFACHLEGKKGPHRNGKKPNLTPETLEQFWMEDVSDEPYEQAAMDYFGVEKGALLKAKERITV